MVPVAAARPPSFAAVNAVIEQRCVVCHNAGLQQKGVALGFVHVGQGFQGVGLRQVQGAAAGALSGSYGGYGGGYRGGYVAPYRGGGRGWRGAFRPGKTSLPICWSMACRSARTS